jgi:hypothetical protein
MLTVPQDPLCRDLDAGRWTSFDNSKFDGTPSDHFSRTSLHLILTDYHVPLFDSGSRGSQDFQIHTMDAVISVRDSGEWVADIDILSAFQSGKIHIEDKRDCNHSKSSSHANQMLSVGSWNEILDCPDAIFVVRAHGNCSARLAIAAVLAQHSTFKDRLRVTVCPSNVCWQCVQSKPKYSPHAYIF